MYSLNYVVLAIVSVIFGILGNAAIANPVVRPGPQIHNGRINPRQEGYGAWEFGKWGKLTARQAFVEKTVTTVVTSVAVSCNHTFLTASIATPTTAGPAPATPGEQTAAGSAVDAVATTISSGPSSTTFLNNATGQPNATTAGNASAASAEAPITVNGADPTAGFLSAAIALVSACVVSFVLL
ncbi:MAG: hypothetical protein M1832_006113 [Thelocarpon impressellum]|nr:MAG: hypothetical protein M1832_006113 [Thelocarpon impressellum]